MFQYLVEEDIFAIAALCSKVFEVTVPIDAVLETELLPKFRTNLITALTSLESLL